MRSEGYWRISECSGTIKVRTKRSVRCAHFLTLSKMQHCVVQIVGFMAWLGLCQTSGSCRLCLCLLNCVRTPAKQNCRRSRSSRLARVGRCSWSGYMYSLRPRGLPRPYGEKGLGTLVGRLFSSTACVQCKPWLLGGSRASCDADRHVQTVQTTLAFMLCVFFICSKPTLDAGGIPKKTKLH